MQKVTLQEEKNSFQSCNQLQENHPPKQLSRSNEQTSKNLRAPYNLSKLVGETQNQRKGIKNIYFFHTSSQDNLEKGISHCQEKKVQSTQLKKLRMQQLQQSKSQQIYFKSSSPQKLLTAREFAEPVLNHHHSQQELVQIQQPTLCSPVNFQARRTSVLHLETTSSMVLQQKPNPIDHNNSVSSWYPEYNQSKIIETQGLKNFQQNLLKSIRKEMGQRHSHMEESNAKNNKQHCFQNHAIVPSFLQKKQTKKDIIANPKEYRPITTFKQYSSNHLNSSSNFNPTKFNNHIKPPPQIVPYCLQRTKKQQNQQFLTKDLLNKNQQKTGKNKNMIKLKSTNNTQKDSKFKFIARNIKETTYSQSGQNNITFPSQHKSQKTLPLFLKNHHQKQIKVSEPKRNSKTPSQTGDKCLQVTFHNKQSQNYSPKMSSSQPNHRFFENIESENIYKDVRLGQSSSNGTFKKENFLNTWGLNSKTKYLKKSNSRLKKQKSQDKKGRLYKHDFKVIKKLGEGKFGVVFLAFHIPTGMIIALKQMEKRRIIQEKYLTQFIRELKIQTYLDHPNIIKNYGFFDDQDKFYSIMELGCDGQLFDLIMDGETLTEQATSFITGNLLDAINYLHSYKIIHRDIKPQNIVLVHGTVKLCDFGWAVNKKNELRSTFCGTPLYLSPELLNGEKYNEKIDIWAIGILCYELLLGRSPFNISSQEDLLKIITDEVSFPTDRKVSKHFRQFIKYALNKDAKKRMTGEELLNLKFISRYRELETCEDLCKEI